MFRHTLAIALALIPAPAIAGAGVGGEIAYALRGGREIYLIDPAGTGKRLVYRAPAKKTVLGLDVKPNGGELTFEEVDSGGQTGRLKTITYGASGMGTVVREIIGCRFSSDTAGNGDLLYVDSCNGTLMYVGAGSTAVSANVPANVSNATWLMDGSFLYAANAQIYRATLAVPSGTSLASQNCVQTLNAAHGSFEAILRDGCGQAINRLQVGSPTTLSSLGLDGISPSYSPDDNCFLYITPSSRGGYLKIRRIQGTSTLQVGGKANYASADWRGDSAADACPVEVGTGTGAFDFKTP